MINITYEMDLMSYLGKNEGREERNFILEEKEKREIYLRQLGNKTDADILIEIEIENKKYIGYEKHLVALLEDKKERLKEAISTTKRELLFLEIREGRLSDVGLAEAEPDLSDRTAVEAFIYLEELGVIDYLRTKSKIGVSNSSLATLLSGIIGVKASTIKPSLNRLSNHDIADSRHPYNTKKTVDKIKTILANLGF
jgi:hypothetical protein